MAVTGDSTLGCGRDLEQVWGGLGRAPDSHEATCGQCIAARESLRDLHRFTSTYRATEPVADDLPLDDLRPSSRVRDAVMAVARAEVRRGRQFPVAETELGPVTVGEQTMLALVRHAIDATSGVRARRVDVDLDAAGRPERCTCRVVVAGTTDIPAVTDAARERVLTVLSRHFRLEPAAVDFVVEDLDDQ